MTNPTTRVTRPRGQTRQRILDTALRRFAEHGYAATSVRDLADELGLTKAAVHYHFAAKEQIVVALVTPTLDRLSAVVEAQAASPAGPRALLLGLRDVLTESGPTLSVLAADPSIVEPLPLLHAEIDRLTARTAEVLAGADASADRLLRAHCALGAFRAGWDVALRGRVGRTPGAIHDADFDVLLDAALACLG